jgi:ABC-type long-subunit fatty acid transport system fused permease/ATPase subunit
VHKRLRSFEATIKHEELPEIELIVKWSDFKIKQ